jgi:hypothetical protein
MDNNKVRRPVRPADFLVIFSELAYNMMQVFTGLAESLMELSIYNANRKTELNKVWEDFANDLETIQEDTDGAN